MDPLERIQAEYRYKVIQLQRKFREENKAFFEAFKEEIVAANTVAGRKVSPAIQDAAVRLAKSQQARLKRAANDAMSETLLLWQEIRKSSEQVDVN